MTKIPDGEPARAPAGEDRYDVGADGDPPIESRLSQIETRWSLIRQAHASDEGAAEAAQADLFGCYQRAIYRYLVAALGRADAADEVFQDFALRLVQRRLRGASPEKGRFRQYLKTILARMIFDFRRKANRPGNAARIEPCEWADDGAAADWMSAEFDENWRSEVLNRTWDQLAASERAFGNAYYSVLRFRAEQPSASSAEMATAMTERLRPERPFTEAGIRQTLKRARERFADLLLDEVAVTIKSADTSDLERELADLELLSYCRSALARRSGQG